MRSAKSSGLIPLYGLIGLGVCSTTGLPRVSSESLCRGLRGEEPRPEEPEADPEAGSSLYGLIGLGVSSTTCLPRVSSAGLCRGLRGEEPRTEEPEADPEAGSSAAEGTCTDCGSARGSNPEEELLGAWTDDACEDDPCLIVKPYLRLTLDGQMMRMRPVKGDP